MKLTSMHINEALKQMSAVAIPDNHPTYWTYWHEPDDEIYKTHTITAPDYRAARKYIRCVRRSPQFMKRTTPRPKAHIRACRAG